MPNGKINNTINSIIKLAIVFLLVVAASTKQEYGFYTILRWCVAGAYCFFAYQSYIKKHLGLVFYFVIVAILFNPLKKVWLGRDTWQIVDYVIAAITTFTIVLDWVGKKE